MTAPRAGMRAADRVALVLVCGAAVLAALLECLLVPVYAGSVVLPVAGVLAVAGNIGLPALARTVCPRTIGAAAPFVFWLVVVVGFGLVTRPEGDVILPGGGAQWASYALLLGGALAGGITIVLLAAPARPPARAGQQTGPSQRPRPPRGG